MVDGDSDGEGFPSLSTVTVTAFALDISGGRVYIIDNKKAPLGSDG